MRLPCLVGMLHHPPSRSAENLHALRQLLGRSHSLTCRLSVWITVVKIVRPFLCIGTSPLLGQSRGIAYGWVNPCAMMAPATDARIGRMGRFIACSITVPILQLA